MNGRVSEACAARLCAAGSDRSSAAEPKGAPTMRGFRTDRADDAGARDSIVIPVTLSSIRDRNRKIGRLASAEYCHAGNNRGPVLLVEKRSAGSAQRRRSSMPRRLIPFLAGLLLLALAAPLPAAAQQNTTDTYKQDEIVSATKDFFGGTSEGLAKIIEKVFREQGEPNGYITGEEAAGAIAVGLRYGNGWLHRKTAGNRRVYWQGPSIGFDLGANASKVFTLVYNLGDSGQIYQRFPGVEGTIYVVGGFGVNYQQAGHIILAPIRTGVGLRAGANVGYLAYTRKQEILPF